MNRLVKLAINDEGFVFDPGSGESYVVNPTGLFILKALKDDTKDDEIIKGLCAEFDVSDEDARTGIADFKDTLAKLGMKLK